MRQQGNCPVTLCLLLSSAGKKPMAIQMLVNVQNCLPHCLLVAYDLPTIGFVGKILMNLPDLPRRDDVWREVDVWSNIWWNVYIAQRRERGK